MVRILIDTTIIVALIGLLGVIFTSIIGPTFMSWREREEATDEAED